MLWALFLPLSVAAQVNFFSETFEGNFPSDNGWSVGDSNGLGSPAYWSDVGIPYGSISRTVNNGSWVGYCAGIGHSGSVVSPNYQDSMDAYMSRPLNLTGHGWANIAFWYTIPSIESCCDRFELYMDNTLVWSTNAANPGFWSQQVVNLGRFAGSSHTLRFNFHSDSSVHNEGAYLDDINVIAIPGQGDLTRSSASLSSSNLHSGELVSTSITILNQSCPSGSAHSGDFHVGYYWSTSTDFSGPAFFEKKVYNCPSNGTVAVDAAFTMNPATLPGTYYLGYKIDDWNEVNECVENNNGIYFWPIQITPAGPVPEILEISCPTTLVIGQWADIAIRVNNNGLQASNGVISVSFPGLTGVTDNTRVMDNGSSPGLPGYQAFPRGTIIQAKGGSAIGASYLDVEWAKRPWVAGEENWLRLRVQPKATGNFVVLVRSAMSPGATSGYTVSPTNGPTDQQGWWVTQRLVNVQSAPSGGSWTPLKRRTPDGEGVGVMLLLPDGNVMAQQVVFDENSDPVSKAWYRLTPDIHGDYVNGTWAIKNSMQDTRQWFSSVVLTNGKVLVAGGEYGTGGSAAELYDPGTDQWSSTPPPGAFFADSVSKILPDGSVLVAPAHGGITRIYNPVSNTWAAGPTPQNPASQTEVTWLKLPDDSILTVPTDSQTSQRFIPSLNRWISDANLPAGISLYSKYASECGGSVLLPNGKAFFLGGDGQTALYTPSGNNNPGTWAAGPSFLPDNSGYPQGAPDAAAAMMVNGKVLCAVSRNLYVDPGPPAEVTWPIGVSFQEYDPVANSFTTVGGPRGGVENISSYETLMLALPDGKVLYTDFRDQLFVYTPAGAPLAAAKPAITNITLNSDGSYHLTGTKLNGISEGATYGDDAQMDSNYPLVRVTDESGDVHYLRTYNWNSTSVMTGNRLVTTEFTNSPGLPPGTFSLVVVANGVSSDPVPFSLARRYTIAALAGAGGNLSPAGSVSLNAGENQMFSASPDADFRVNQWLLDGTLAQAGGSTYTVTNIQANHTVQVTFTSCALLDTIPPTLTIQQQDQNLLICWPATCMSYVLEQTSEFQEPIQWTSVNAPVMPRNGGSCLSLRIAEGNVFFRLTRP